MSQNLNTWDVFWTDKAECSRKVESETRVAGVIRSMVQDRSLQLECVRVLHESLLVPVLTYGSETMIWRERDLGLELYRWTGLLNIRRMDKVLNA